MIEFRMVLPDTFSFAGNSLPLKSLLKVLEELIFAENKHPKIEQISQPPHTAYQIKILPGIFL